jgi:hypothetical protein
MRVLLVLSLALLTSCGLFSRGQLRDGVYEGSGVRYRLKSPVGDWRRVSVASADVAWIHDELGASLLVNSHCRGVQDAPLEALAGHLLIGFTERALLAERKLELSRREALEREVQAKLDGVPRHLLLLVLKKDGCVYDVVLDATPAGFARARPAYEGMLQGLDVYAREEGS